MTAAQLVLLKSSFAQVAHGTSIYRAKIKASADKFAGTGGSIVPAMGEVAAAAAAVPAASLTEALVAPAAAESPSPVAAVATALSSPTASAEATGAAPGAAAMPSPTATAAVAAAAVATAATVSEEDNPASALYSPVAFFFDTFYDRLFAVAPAVRPLFKNDMKVQGRALVRMVDAAIGLLERPVELKAALVGLAVRHVKYGAELTHYAVVGEVLLYALQTCLGPEEWQPDVALAWVTVYSMMISVMMSAHVQEMRRVAAEAAAPPAAASATAAAATAPAQLS